MKRTPIRRVSLKRAKANRSYSKLAKTYKDLNPWCHRCTNNPTRDVHHKTGRSGSNMMDVKTWCALCRTCHNWVHDNPGEARRTGWLV